MNDLLPCNTIKIYCKYNLYGDDSYNCYKNISNLLKISNNYTEIYQSNFLEVKNNISHTY